MITAEIFTDGSCHTQFKTGSWVAIIFIQGKKILLSGSVMDTTHNRMELTAVIKAIEYIKETQAAVAGLRVVSDSQYVIGLISRKEKLTSAGFTNKKGETLNNADLVIQFLDLCTMSSIEWVKIKAHQKQNETVNYNIEADKLSRAIVREEVRKIQSSKRQL